MHEYFVICPVDKASKNVAIICKKYYLETISNECMTNSVSYNNISDLNILDIFQKQKIFMNDNFKLNGSNIENYIDELPHIVLFPKFHKPKLSQRFVVCYANCVIKPLAKLLTLGGSLF